MEGDFLVLAKSVVPTLSIQTSPPARSLFQIQYLGILQNYSIGNLHIRHHQPPY